MGQGLKDAIYAGENSHVNTGRYTDCVTRLIVEEGVIAPVLLYT